MEKKEQLLIIKPEHELKFRGKCNLSIGDFGRKLEELCERK